jgi:hypothetical protein
MSLQFLTPVVVSVCVSAVVAACARHHHIESQAGATFTFSPVVGYLMFVGGWVFCLVPFLPGAAGDIPTTRFFFIFSPFWGAAFVASAFFFRYKVLVGQRAVVISSLWERAIPFETIVSCEVVPSGRGRELVLQVQNGKTARFSSLLGDFDKLVWMIATHTKESH